MILLDTQVLIWLLFDDRKLGVQARRVIDDAWTAGAAFVSAISFWEMTMLHEKRRLDLLIDVGALRENLLTEGLPRGSHERGDWYPGGESPRLAERPGGPNCGCDGVGGVPVGDGGSGNTGVVRGLGPDGCADVTVGVPLAIAVCVELWAGLGLGGSGSGALTLTMEVQSTWSAGSQGV